MSRGSLRAWRSEQRITELGSRGVGPAGAHFGAGRPRHEAWSRATRRGFAFEQTEALEVELRSTIRGFFPTLSARPGSPRWAGLLYSHGQRRLHQAISRCYFVRLIGESRT